MGKAAWLKDWHAARAINEPFAWEMNSTTQDGSRSAGEGKGPLRVPRNHPYTYTGTVFSRRGITGIKLYSASKKRIPLSETCASVSLTRVSCFSPPQRPAVRFVALDGGNRRSKTRLQATSAVERGPRSRFFGSRSKCRVFRKKGSESNEKSPQR